MASRRCKGDLPTLTAAAAAPTGVDGTRMRSWSATDQDRCRAPRTRRQTAAIRSAPLWRAKKTCCQSRSVHAPAFLPTSLTYSRPRSVVRRSHRPELLYTGVSTDGGQFPGRRSPVASRLSKYSICTQHSHKRSTLPTCRSGYMCRSAPSTAESQWHSPVQAHFQRKCTKTRPKLFESFSTRWYRALTSFRYLSR